MKDSEAYKILQRLVILNNSIADIDKKIEILRLLIEQEDLALYIEEHEKQEGGENESV